MGTSLREIREQEAARGVGVYGRSDDVTRDGRNSSHPVDLGRHRDVHRQPLRPMKRALLVGIDRYDRFGGLKGCVNDVTALSPLLGRNEDDSPNFSCQEQTSALARVDRRDLLEALDALFLPGAEVALFYFAGHG